MKSIFIFCLFFLSIGVIKAQTVVVDLGATTLRAGLSTSTAPTVNISHNFISNGAVTDLAQFELKMTEVFNQLKLQSDKCSLVITEKAPTIKANREAVTKVLFEKFSIANLYIYKSANGAALQQGKQTAIIVNIEDGLIQAVPVYGGIALSQGVIRFEPNVTMEQIQSNKLVIHTPSIIAGGIDHGISQTVYDCIYKCDVDIRSELYGNIIIVGDKSNIEDIASTISTEVSKLAPPTAKIKVTLSANGATDAWSGGQKLVTMLTSDMYFSKAEFTSQGASAIHKKIF